MITRWQLIKNLIYTQKNYAYALSLRMLVGNKKIKVKFSKALMH
jgi:hypothetical protein